MGSARAQAFAWCVAVLAGLAAHRAWANPLIFTDTYGFSGSPSLYWWIVGSSLLIEYLAVRYLLRDWAKFRHVLPAFLVINMVTFPVTHLLGIRYMLLAEAFPITVEPLLYFGMFYVLHVDVPSLTTRIITANAVSFVAGLLGYNGMVMLKGFLAAGL